MAKKLSIANDLIIRECNHLGEKAYGLYSPKRKLWFYYAYKSEKAAAKLLATGFSPQQIEVNINMPQAMKITDAFQDA